VASAILGEVGSRLDVPRRHQDAPVEELSPQTLQDSLQTLQSRASAEIKKCLRTAYAELCPSHPVSIDQEQAEDEVRLPFHELSPLLNCPLGSTIASDLEDLTRHTPTLSESCGAILNCASVTRGRWFVVLHYNENRRLH